MKSLISIIGALFLSIGVGSNAHANWVLDEARWHVSAHGQIMCLDCHGDVGKEHCTRIRPTSTSAPEAPSVRSNARAATIRSSPSWRLGDMAGSR